MVKPRVYIETTVVSRLTAWPSRNPDVAAEQKTTREWWDGERSSFVLCTSQRTRSEAEKGDTAAARDRLEALEAVADLEETADAIKLAKEFLALQAFPDNAAVDALHVAIAAVWAVPFLLTWNMRHIGNAMTRPLIQQVCFANGFQCPVICSPGELRGPRS